MGTPGLTSHKETSSGNTRKQLWDFLASEAVTVMEDGGLPLAFVRGHQPKEKLRGPVASFKILIYLDGLNHQFGPVTSIPWRPGDFHWSPAPGRCPYSHHTCHGCPCEEEKQIKRGFEVIVTVFFHLFFQISCSAMYKI